MGGRTKGQRSIITQHAPCTCVHPILKDAEKVFHANNIMCP